MHVTHLCSSCVSYKPGACCLLLLSKVAKPLVRIRCVWTFRPGQTCSLYFYIKLLWYQASLRKLGTSVPSLDTVEISRQARAIKLICRFVSLLQVWHVADGQLTATTMEEHQVRVRSTFVHMYAHLHIHTHTHRHAHTRTHTRTHTNACAYHNHTHMQKHDHAHTHAQTTRTNHLDCLGNWCAMGAEYQDCTVFCLNR